MFENKIVYWAKERGLKHKYLAEHCSVSEQTFVRWVKNKNQPPLDKAFILAKLFQINVDQLGTLKEEE